MFTKIAPVRFASMLATLAACGFAPSWAAEPTHAVPVPKANLELIGSLGRCEPAARQTYLYVLRLVDPRVMNDATTWERAVVDEHWLFLRSLAEAGLIDVIGRTTTPEPEAIGIAIMRVCSAEEVERIRANDPTSIAGIHRAEFKPFRVAWPRDLEGKVHDDAR